jgi:plastocyanin
VTKGVGLLVGLVVSLSTVGATAAPAAALEAPHAELVSSARVAPDVQRMHYRYGPVLAAPGQNLILVGPVTLERPAGDGFSIRFKPGLERSDGTVPPVEKVHMHHAVYLNMSRQDLARPELPERFFAFAEEKTIGAMPDGYGYPLPATDVLAINYMLHNGTPEPEVVWITYDIDWVPADTALGKAMKPARPVWLDVENGKAYPVFDVKRFTGAGGQMTYPDDAQPAAYPAGERRNEWTVDRDSVLLTTAGHVHPGGLWTDLDVVRGGAKRLAFRSEARYFDPNGPVSWDMAMTVPPPDWKVAVRKGDVLRVSATYDTSRASWYESMGIMLVYLADGREGHDPFAGPVQTTGDVTHGHLPEAGNYGGSPGGLPDASKLADGQTIDSRVGISNFGYMPGDLSGSGVFGLPPAIQPGQSLDFGNLDAMASVLHTVTACRQPCNRATGISYPLADGDADFDSGQLGYGPQGYTAAAQRAEWKTPPDLEPGTYTYFCRVHPYMRGAFRVAGSPLPRTLSLAPRAVRATRGGRVHVQAACDGSKQGGCVGTIALRRGNAALGTVPLVVRARQTQDLTFVLSRRDMRHLRRAKRMALTVSATIDGATAAQQRLVVVAPRRRR